MLSLSAEVRNNKGKKLRDLRRDGFLPAVLYGPEIEPQSIKIKAGNFENIYQTAGESSLIDMKVADKGYKVLIHEIQRDPVSG